MRQRFIDACRADMSGGKKSTGVRWWLKYCIYGRQTSPFTRLPSGSPLEDQLEAEQMFMDFVLWLALCRPSGYFSCLSRPHRYLSRV